MKRKEYENHTAVYVTGEYEGVVYDYMPAIVKQLWNVCNKREGEIWYYIVQPRSRTDDRACPALQVPHTMLSTLCPAQSTGTAHKIRSIGPVD